MDVLPTEYVHRLGVGGGWEGDMMFCYHRMLCARTGGLELPLHLPHKVVLFCSHV